MFKHILVAIDGSSYTEQALPTAIEVARQFESSLFVLHVAEHDRGRAAAYSIESPAEATMLVAKAIKQAKEAGLTAKGELKDKAAGHVAAAIAETVAENGIDLIVMGSRGLSDAQGFLVGSVTHRVMQIVDVPVLVVRKPVGVAAGVAGPEPAGP
jgi:nucleotide-binding universal stress UspA family protein